MSRLLPIPRSKIRSRRELRATSVSLLQHGECVAATSHKPTLVLKTRADVARHTSHARQRARPCCRLHNRLLPRCRRQRALYPVPPQINGFALYQPSRHFFCMQFRPLLWPFVSLRPLTGRNRRSSRYFFLPLNPCEWICVQRLVVLPGLLARSRWKFEQGHGRLTHSHLCRSLKLRVNNMANWRNVRYCRRNRDDGIASARR